MRKTNIIGIVMLLALLALPMASAATSMDASISRYEPLPAQPGQYVTVYIELENIGSEDAPKAAIEIEDAFPFRVLSNDDKLQTIGELKAQRSYIVDARVLVNSEAAVGTNYLKVRFTSDTQSGNWQERLLAIEVKEDDTSLSISEVSTIPETITPGGEGTITLTVKNSQAVTLRNIALQLGLYTTQGSAVTDLPFIPTNSATEKKISRLNPGEISQVSFDIKSYPTATPGYYKLPLTMTFFDDQGTETEKTDIIGVVISAVPELKIYIEGKENLQAQSEGTITLKFVNKGINDLKFLDVEVLESDEYSINDNKEYIGDLDSDDYRSETFTLTPRGDQINLQVKVSYKDENNKAYESVENLVVTCDCEKTNGESNYTTTIVIAVLAIVVLLLLIGRRKKKKRRK